VSIQTVIADYTDPRQGEDLLHLLDTYSRDEMGDSAPLDGEVRRNLLQELSKLPHAFSVLCYVNDQPAGLINCFEAFSTFKSRPLVNVHDVMVAPDFRGLGLSQIMMAKVEEIAKEKGCCKITLEVLEGNTVARNAYEKFGFDGCELDPALGKALFLEKQLDAST
jgi:ribosomal protein S18 acetylase RimI-like enzyme